jgi:hypothetical protein
MNGIILADVFLSACELAPFKLHKCKILHLKPKSNTCKYSINEENIHWLRETLSIHMTTNFWLLGGEYRGVTNIRP